MAKRPTLTIALDCVAHIPCFSDSIYPEIDFCVGVAVYRGRRIIEASIKDDGVDIKPKQVGTAFIKIWAPIWKGPNTMKIVVIETPQPNYIDWVLQKPGKDHCCDNF